MCKLNKNKTITFLVLCYFKYPGDFWQCYPPPTPLTVSNIPLRYIKTLNILISLHCHPHFENISTIYLSNTAIITQTKLNFIKLRMQKTRFTKKMKHHEIIINKIYNIRDIFQTDRGGRVHYEKKGYNIWKEHKMRIY